MLSRPRRCGPSELVGVFGRFEEVVLNPEELFLPLVRLAVTSCNPIIDDLEHADPGSSAPLEDGSCVLQ